MERCLCPGGGGQLSDTVGGMGADSVEHVTEIGKGVKMAQFAGGDEAVDDGCPFGTLVTPRKQPVLPPDGDGPKNSFGQVVVYWRIDQTSPHPVLQLLPTCPR